MSINPYLYYRIKESIRERDDSFSGVYRKNRQLLDETKKAKIELKEKTKEIVEQWKVERRMQNKIDIIIDVSKKLTQQWVTARAMGIDHPEAWIYAEMPTLLNDAMPAHFGLVMSEIANMKRERAVFILEGISSDLSQLCVIEGWLVERKKDDTN